MTDAITPVTFRPATEDDVEQLHDFVVSLAHDEDFPDDVVATSEDLREALFGARPVADAVIAERGGRPIGFAVYYFAYSTVVGRPTLHLEDLYVAPEHRSGGVGRSLLGHLARLAIERGCGRFEWWVLRTNDRAIRLYKKMGARELDEIDVMRVDGDALTALAQV
ncbi:GNAT family N-acetyltransferase [Gryllotalpicola ginsengisoli]|uniref:GNAT family N-acetyltransferase n=1 Tax=Gryllotalpicola ginsengisoli TaxID=444608 RepID=UPI000489BB21|nr:GNAT family N-acetyltransferase [Gryllotalpicola ginsengisoli]